MKVLHYGKYYPPYRGGVETVMASICRGLAERGVEVTALVSNDCDRHVEEVLDGVRVVRLARRRLLFSQPICRGVDGFLRAWDGDIVHLHFPNPLAAWHCLRAKPKGAWLGLHHSDIIRQRLFAAPANFVQGKFYQKAAAITIPTPRHAEFSSLLSNFRDKCRVIHFGIDPAPFAEDGGHVASVLPEEWQGKPFFLFVGRLVYYKGVDVLLKALAAIDGARLAVVGTGPLRAELEALARSLCLMGEGDDGGRVNFCDEVSSEDLHCLYRQTRALVLPSVARSEAFGMVQLEAMAAGRPVISTNLPSGVPYVNVDGETGIIVEPGDVESLRKALENLLCSVDMADEYGASGKLRVNNEFCESSMVDGYISLYNELIPLQV
ncbi:MAG: glycosyltransferase [Planctomycetes bacterium]|nr:glycosyltransferase [Planctomycetota bacterium]